MSVYLSLLFIKFRLLQRETKLENTHGNHETFYYKRCVAHLNGFDLGSTPPAYLQHLSGCLRLGVDSSGQLTASHASIRVFRPTAVFPGG